MQLTKFTTFGGCGAKIAPGLLDKALCGLPRMVDPGLLVDFSTSDDAGVYQISPDTALVQTLDFFPPIVDDPRTFGMIAAANALSDVYAMGGRPVTAMSIVGFPLGTLDIEVLGEIIQGALEILREADTPLVGGHSIQDGELKFGLSVTGLVHPREVWKNNTLAAGDRLIITKPLGTGTINMALREGRAHPEAVEAATRSMVQLNRRAAETIRDFGVSACTDVTGFGLIGHASEMVVHSSLGMEIDAAGLRILPRAAEYVSQGLTPGGTKNNLEFRGPLVENLAELRDCTRGVLFDPQTSGGLLFGVAENRAEECLKALVSQGVEACYAGRVIDVPGKIRITGQIQG